MSKENRIQKYLPLIDYMSKGKHQVVQALIDEADRDVVNILCECALNCLKGNVKLTKPQLNRLCQHKQHLRRLVKVHVPLKEKKKILQKGGLLEEITRPVARMFFRNQTPIEGMMFA